MSGTIIAAVVIEMIFTIGLGLMLLRIHNEIERFLAMYNRQIKAEAEFRDQIENRIAECETTDVNVIRAVTMTDDELRKVLLTVQDMRAYMAAINKKTKGTTDEQEFLRIKNQALLTLPNQIARLEALVMGKPLVTRIEKRDGMIAMRYVVDDEVKEKFEKEEVPDA